MTAAQKPPLAFGLKYPSSLCTFRVIMRVLAAAIFLVLALSASAQSRSAARSLDRVVVLGTAYCRLNQWSEVCGFKMRWDKKTGAVNLVNRSARLSFLINSRRSQINGETILLSMPVIARGDEVLVPAIELQTTIQPIFFPHKNPAKTAVRTICLDPGHGGKDTGKIERTHQEKKYTLLLAQEVASLLKVYNLKVVMTRTRDETLELSDRPDFARRKGADLFVSLHYNAAGAEVGGVEVYCLTPAGMASSNEGGGRSSRQGNPGNSQNSQNILLAYEVQKHILRSTGLEDRGLKRSRFAVLRDARMPAVLVEGGFMSNPADARKIYDATFRKKMAQAIVDGIIAYKRTVERP